MAVVWLTQKAAHSGALTTHDRTPSDMSDLWVNHIIMNQLINQLMPNWQFSVKFVTSNPPNQSTLKEAAVCKDTSFVKVATTLCTICDSAQQVTDRPPSSLLVLLLEKREGKCKCTSYIPYLILSGTCQGQF